MIIYLYIYDCDVPSCRSITHVMSHLCCYRHVLLQLDVCGLVVVIVLFVLSVDRAFEPVEEW
jgi:hypothetical protein